MRISDWSSDVCSSDLPEQFERDLRRIDFHDVARARHGERREGGLAEEMRGDAFVALGISRRPIVEPHPRVVQRDKILAIARQMLVAARARSEEHTSELQSLMRISYAVFCLKNNNQ